jgi:hypothetical protein
MVCAKAREKEQKMNTKAIKELVYGVTTIVVGVLVANQIQKAIDKARVSSPTQP